MSERVSDLQAAYLAGEDDGVGREDEEDEGDAREARRPEDLPEEVEGDDDDEGRRPREEDELRRVLDLLRVDRHQVDDLPDGGSLARSRRQQQGLVETARRKRQIKLFHFTLQLVSVCPLENSQINVKLML